MTHIRILREADNYRIRKDAVDGARTFAEKIVPAGFIGNIYLGTVVSISRNAQGAFVDFGGDEEGYLPVSQVLSAYGNGGGQDSNGYRDRRRPDIHTLLRPGQTVLVQVNEDRSNSKGFVLTTHVSLASNLLVIMPGNPSRAVSKKISDDLERDRLLAVLEHLQPPEDLGYVLRTDSEYANQATLRRELVYLLALWAELTSGLKNLQAPALVYEAAEPTIRLLGTWIDGEVQRVEVESALLKRQLGVFLRCHHKDASLELVVSDNAVGASA